MLGELRSAACLENFETSNFQIKKLYYTAQKMKFFIKDLVTFTEKILNEKLFVQCFNYRYYYKTMTSKDYIS